jgi:hypothetical protein
MHVINTNIARQPLNIRLIRPRQIIPSRRIIISQECQYFRDSYRHKRDRNGSPRDRSPQYNICAFSTVMVHESGFKRHDPSQDEHRNLNPH